jgi:uncharacterized protein with GYD domain
MAKYLIKASYGAEGVKGIVKDGGSSRFIAVTKMIQGMGGSLESFYFSFGETDIYAIADLPGGNADAAAVAAAVGSSGAMSSYETVVLMSPEEVDAAMQKAVDYSPPGS